MLNLNRKFPLKIVSLGQSAALLWMASGGGFCRFSRHKFQFTEGQYLLENCFASFVTEKPSQVVF